jgi:small subunit ribosomal protein S13
MPRIAGIDIPDKKQIKFSLRYVYGIGPFLASEILKKAKVEPTTKTSDLTSSQINAISQVIIDDHLTEGELKRSIINNIRRLKDIGSWRGMRHSRRLPVRGQRTKRNSRTVRGNKKATVGSGRKAAPAPK